LDAIVFEDDAVSIIRVEVHGAWKVGMDIGRI
jgi:hypothetical protein